MKKHSIAIKNLRLKIKSSAEEGQAVRREIHALTWKDSPEAQEALRAVKEARRAGGRQTLGKRFLKPFRRPETCSERYGLWNEKRIIGETARHCLIALTLLRGRPYHSCEPKCGEENHPSCGYILNLIHNAIGDDEALKAEWTQERIIDLVLMPENQEAA